MLQTPVGISALAYMTLDNSHAGQALSVVRDRLNLLASSTEHDATVDLVDARRMYAARKAERKAKIVNPTIVNVPANVSAEEWPDLVNSEVAVHRMHSFQ